MLAADLASSYVERALRADRLVLVFARSPAEERRRKPLVGAGRRVEALHAALLRRTLDVARTAGARTRLCTTGAAPIGSDDLEVVAQTGDSFAERLERAVAGAFADGWRRVVVVGADAPGLRARHLAQAFDAIDGDERRAAIGPAADGGYWLLALNSFDAAPFRVPLSSDDTGRATRDALAHAGFGIATLERLNDLDDAADLAQLAGDRELGRLARELLSVSPSPRSDAPVREFLVAASIRARGPPVLASSIT
jgi:glycosyltransferase A (GT-A) superfamily protein (DUF2064 family)